MKEKTSRAISLLEDIIGYHNKNLTKKQYYDLIEILDIIKEVYENV